MKERRKAWALLLNGFALGGGLGIFVCQPISGTPSDLLNLVPLALAIAVLVIYRKTLFK